MMFSVEQVKNSADPHRDISGLLALIHKNGPNSSEILQLVSLYKEFHGEIFSKIEEKIISSMGLFYKVSTPKNLYSFILSGIGDEYKEAFGKTLTPVQASVRWALEENQFISISAPTSAGKSFSIRDFIAQQTGDAVVVVPSRALIAEYINTMRAVFGVDKGVMVSAFVDDVFKKRKLRHIFVLTPERARELFLIKAELNVDVFFFDEAQMSEEPQRGVVFDVLVRRVRKLFPLAKLIFAHPFVENPEAQFKKHGIEESKYARSYNHGAVGKICIFRHANKKDFYFSPFGEGGYLLDNCIKFDGGFEKFAFTNKHSILIYVSKASIYNGKFVAPFQDYIDGFPAVVDADALEMISTIEQMLGADEKEHRSAMVMLLKKGVVIHHGSVPLDVRFLIEDFIRQGHARICFATSTLAQGINMPFDIVWLESMRIIGKTEAERALAFKNLIGRAGRLSEKKKFDYGYVYTKSADLFSQRINETFELSEISVVDKLPTEVQDDSQELVDSIRDDTFDDEHNLPRSKIGRLSEDPIFSACLRILDVVYLTENISDTVVGKDNEPNRLVLISDFKMIFEASLGRELYDGEGAIFEQAIRILLLTLGGKTFREIVGQRFSYISNRDGNRTGGAKFSQKAEKLPDSSIKKKYPFFTNTLAKDVSYDAIVFDTYDYMDQVISFSLSDVFSAAFKIYGEKSKDVRSLKMLELLRFGTNNDTYMLLMRYGFAPEIVAEIAPYILRINEREIVFSPNVKQAPNHIQEIVEWYLP
ncbi:DEAD/DEAH box helicase [Duganella lactea]|nr:DEAD/DEAH box helicase [Duganella lactea]